MKNFFLFSLCVFNLVSSAGLNLNLLTGIKNLSYKKYHDIVRPFRNKANILTITNNKLKKFFPYKIYQNEPFNIIDESEYLFNNRIKIYIHLEELIGNTNIYHIGVSFNSILDNVRYDLRGYNVNFNYNIFNKDLREYTIFWGYSNKTIEEIKRYEESLRFKYILGWYDCRHYVKNLTIWSCGDPTPVWNINSLIKKIET